MHQTIEIRMAEKTGIPYALVPEDAMWSLVEYLAVQRVQVSYSYQDGRFSVCFPHLTAEPAQQLLDDWHAFERASLESSRQAEEFFMSEQTMPAQESEPRQSRVMH
jgi:hypothetical protein